MVLKAFKGSDEGSSTKLKYSTLLIFTNTNFSLERSKGWKKVWPYAVSTIPQFSIMYFAYHHSHINGFLFKDHI